ncbi:cobyric acid synthase [Aeromicrobium sp.]|uniref:cobyric acid synthase n=1 Tax=Aeromicrobium sp. TaxID=1871063 RepID=UPI003C680C8F
MTALLIAGTTSDAGKTIVTTALCRAFARRGVRVAPFKAQNMSNNSMVVRGPGVESDSAEIGRAQWVQALAAGVQPEAAMNPVLLKPGGDRRSHVVVMGKPAGEIASSEFIGGRTHLAEAAYAAYDDLASRFDLVVCEGAGSPAEINLRAGDYVNMGLARHADMPVVVVGDIDRGGVFAAMYGTVALLDAADQRLMAGFIVNKFRGDEMLLRPGLDRLEQITGRRVHGVLPWSPDVWLDSEDALDLASRRSSNEGSLRVAVIRLPRISNFTDVDALGIEPGVDVAFVTEPRSMADADLVVLPGTRATLADLSWLRARGLDLALLDHADAGRPVLGICGGFQMLGRTISDPDGVEGVRGAEVAGLGLLDVTTTFGPDKVLRLHDEGGYEIHHGRVELGDVDEFLGGARDQSVFGTMHHGSLESDEFRRAFLADAAASAGRELLPSTASFSAARAIRLDLLGDLAEKHLDLDALLTLAHDGAPDVPLLAPGAQA